MSEQAWKDACCTKMSEKDWRGKATDKLIDEIDSLREEVERLKANEKMDAARIDDFETNWTPPAEGDQTRVLLVQLSAALCAKDREIEELRRRLKPAEYCATMHCDCDQANLVKANIDAAKETKRKKQPRQRYRHIEGEVP